MIRIQEMVQYKYDIQKQQEIEGKLVEEVSFEKRKARNVVYWYSPHILQVNGKKIDIQPIIGHEELRIMLEEYLQGLFLDLFPPKYNFSIKVSYAKRHEDWVYDYHIDVRWL